MFEVKKIIFNNPATIVYWADGTKTIVKCGKNDVWDKEKGLAMCFTKKALGNAGNFNEKMKKYLAEDVYEPVKTTSIPIHDLNLSIAAIQFVDSGCPCWMF